MEQFPTSAPEAPKVEQNPGEGAETLTSTTAAELGGAALNAANIAAQAVAAAEKPIEGATGEVSAAETVVAEAATIPGGATVETTVAVAGMPVPEVKDVNLSGVTGGEAAPATTEKMSDMEMINYVIGRLHDDLSLPDVKAHPEKAKEIEASIQIFDLAAYVVGDNKHEGKEPVSVEAVLSGIASQNRYMADKSESETDKAEHSLRAKLADEWAESYGKRKARLEEERAEGAKPGAAPEAPEVPVVDGTVVTEEKVVEAAPAPEAHPTVQMPGVNADVAAMTDGVNPGENPVATNPTATAGAEQMPVSPANAGETTQPNAVPLSTEGIV